jgi:chromosome segregation ATPase
MSPAETLLDIQSHGVALLDTSIRETGSVVNEPYELILKEKQQVIDNQKRYINQIRKERSALKKRLGEQEVDGDKEVQTYSESILKQVDDLKTHFDQLQHQLSQEQARNHKLSNEAIRNETHVSELKDKIARLMTHTDHNSDHIDHEMEVKNLETELNQEKEKK